MPVLYTAFYKRPLNWCLLLAGCFHWRPIFNSVSSCECLNLNPPHTAHTRQLFCMHANDGNSSPAGYGTFYFIFLWRKGSGADFLLWYHRQHIFPLKRHTNGTHAKTMTHSQLRWHRLRWKSWPLAPLNTKWRGGKKKRFSLTLIGMVLWRNWPMRVWEKAVTEKYCVISALRLTVVKWGAKCCSDCRASSPLPLSLSLSHSLCLFVPPPTCCIISQHIHDSLWVVERFKSARC